MSVVNPHVRPAIQIDSKQKQFQYEQKQSSVHAECRLPLDVFVSFNGCKGKSKIKKIITK